MLLLVLLLFVLCTHGSIAQYKAEEDMTMTNGTAMLSKLYLSIEVPADNTYMVEWNAEIQSCIMGHSIRTCLLQDSSIPLNEQIWDPGPQWGAAFGFVVVNLTSGQHDFDIKYGSTDDGGKVSIRRTRIKVEEINL